MTESMERVTSLQSTSLYDEHSHPTMLMSSYLGHISLLLLTVYVLLPSVILYVVFFCFSPQKPKAERTATLAALR